MQADIHIDRQKMDGWMGGYSSRTSVARTLMTILLLERRLTDRQIDIHASIDG